MVSALERPEEHRIFSGWQQHWCHASAVLYCPMTCSIFLPPQDDIPPPAVWFLARLDLH